MLSDHDLSERVSKVVIPEQIEELFLAYIYQVEAYKKQYGHVDVAFVSPEEKTFFERIQQEFNEGTIGEAVLQKIITTAKDLLKNGNVPVKLEMIGETLKIAAYRKAGKDATFANLCSQMQNDPKVAEIVTLLCEGKNPFVKKTQYGKYGFLPADLLITAGGKPTHGVFEKATSGTTYFKCDITQKTIFVAPHPSDRGRWIGKEGLRQKVINSILGEISWKMQIFSGNYERLSSDSTWTNPDAVTRVIFKEKETGTLQKHVGEEVFFYAAAANFYTYQPHGSDFALLAWGGRYDPKKDRLYLTEDTHKIKFEGDPHEFCQTFAQNGMNIPYDIITAFPLWAIIKYDALGLTGWTVTSLEQKIKDDLSKGWLIPSDDVIANLKSKLKIIPTD